MGKSKQRGGWSRTLLICLLILSTAVLSGGCKKLQSLLPGGEQPVATTTRGDRLVAYDQEGYIWTIQAIGEGAQQVSKTGDLMLGPWAPDAAKMAVITAVNRNGEWVQGNAGVLDLNGNLKLVVGPRGPVVIQPGQMSWLDGQNLVLGGNDTIWMARPDGNQYRATALYAIKPSSSERVWHPKGVPGAAYVSFWATTTQGEGGSVKARLVIIPAAGGKADDIFSETILASGQAPVDAVWSLDGQYVLVYAEASGGGNPWWLLDRKKGTRQAVLSTDAGDVQWLQGNQLIYAPQAQLQVPKYALFDAATGKSKPFATIPNWVTWLQVASDNRLLLAKATGDNSIKWDYYVAAADGSNAKKILSGAGDAAWQP